MHYEGSDYRFISYAQEKTSDVKLNISVDKDRYEKKIGQTIRIEITGEITGHSRGVPVLLEIIDPKGNITELVVRPTQSGEVSIPYTLSSDSSLGIYKIIPSYNNQKFNEVSFEVIPDLENNQPPVPIIDIRMDPPYTVGKSIIFSAKNSHDPDGVIEEFEWDFGDGVIATNGLVPHAYLRNGTYTVKLTVYDNLGSSETASKSINIEPNLADFLVTIEEEKFELIEGQQRQAEIIIIPVEGETEIMLNCNGNEGDDKINCNIFPSDLKVKGNTPTKATLNLNMEIKDRNYQFEIVAIDKHSDKKIIIPLDVSVKSVMDLFTITESKELNLISLKDYRNDSMFQTSNFLIIHNSSDNVKLYLEKTNQGVTNESRKIIHFFDEPGEFLITISENEKHRKNEVSPNSENGKDAIENHNKINEWAEWSPFTVSIFIILPTGVLIIAVIFVIKKQTRFQH